MVTEEFYFSNMNKASLFFLICEKPGHCFDVIFDSVYGTSMQGDTIC